MKEVNVVSNAVHYKRIQHDLGWRKITSLNLVIMQDAINKLCSDNARKNSKNILVDMLDKAVDTNLLMKNVAKQINPIITGEKKKERRVFTVEETEQFLKQAEGTFYYELFVLALISETNCCMSGILCVILVKVENIYLKCMIPKPIMGKG